MRILGYSIGRDRALDALDDAFKQVSNPGVPGSADSVFDESFINLLKTSKDDSKSISAIVSKLKESTFTRAERYKIYKEVAKDPIVGQAIEMMADDSTQFDVDRERTVWVEGEEADKEYCDAINGILADYVEPFIDTLASYVI